MDYGNERDALRDRVDNLESDLADAHVGTDRDTRAAQIEARMADARQLLDDLGRELEQVRGVVPPPPPRRPAEGNAAAIVVPMLVIGTIALGAVAGVLLFRKASPKKPVPVAMFPRDPYPAGSTPSADPTAPLAPTGSAERDPPSAPRQVVAHWSARVTRATGSSLHVGSACSVDATIEARDGKSKIVLLDVACGGGAKPLYRSSDKTSGMSMTTTGIQEELGEQPGTTRYALHFEDTGARTGARSQVSINTLKSVVEVWSDSAPSFRVGMSVAVKSQPVVTSPLMDGTRKTSRESFTVKQVTGTVPVKAGTVCQLRASPADEKQCHLQLVCGPHILYGKGGNSVAPCTVGDEAMTSAADESPSSKDGDPTIKVDGSTGTIEVSDDQPTPGWSVTLNRAP